MARFTTLYSGSSGNCAFLEEDGRYILIDMGKSCRTTVAGLKSLGVTSGMLGGILITHEHSDHIGGLAVFLKHYPVPLYGSNATLQELKRRGAIPLTTTLIPLDGVTQDITGFAVQNFDTSHDAAGPCGFRITTPKGKTLAFATDLGFISDEVMANLYLADMVALEANYDYHMLMIGRYPPYLKQRVDSNKGHLSNDECAAALTKLALADCKRFSLCHISQENNIPELALQTVLCQMTLAGIKQADGIRVQAANRHEVAPVFEF